MPEGEPDQHGQQRGDGEPQDGPRPQPDRAGAFAQLGDRGGDGEQHQRRDHHADQVQIDVADRLEPDLGLLAQDQAGDDAEREARGGALPQGDGEESGEHGRRLSGEALRNMFVAYLRTATATVTIRDLYL